MSFDPMMTSTAALLQRIRDLERQVEERSTSQRQSSSAISADSIGDHTEINGSVPVRSPFLNREIGRTQTVSASSGSYGSPGDGGNNSFTGSQTNAVIGTAFPNGGSNLLPNRWLNNSDRSSPRVQTGLHESQELSTPTSRPSFARNIEQFHALRSRSTSLGDFRQIQQRSIARRPPSRVRVMPEPVRANIQLSFVCLGKPTDTSAPSNGYLARLNSVRLGTGYIKFNNGADTNSVKDAIIGYYPQLECVPFTLQRAGWGGRNARILNDIDPRDPVPDLDRIMLSARARTTKVFVRPSQIIYFGEDSDEESADESTEEVQVTGMISSAGNGTSNAEAASADRFPGASALSPGLQNVSSDGIESGSYWNMISPQSPIVRNIYPGNESQTNQTTVVCSTGLDQNQHSPTITLPAATAPPEVESVLNGAVENSIPRNNGSRNDTPQATDENTDSDGEYADDTLQSDVGELLRANRDYSLTQTVVITRCNLLSETIAYMPFLDVNKTPYVRYNGESGIDEGALLRDWLWNASQEILLGTYNGIPLFDGPVNHKLPAADVHNDEVFKAVGKFAFVSALHQGIGLPYLSRAVVEFFLLDNYDNCTQLAIRKKDLSPDVRDVIKLVEMIGKGQQLSNAEMMEVSLMANAIGFGQVAAENSAQAIKAMMQHDVIDKRRSQLDCLKNIFDELGLISFLKTNPRCIKTVFPTSSMLQIPFPMLWMCIEVKSPVTAVLKDAQRWIREYVAEKRREPQVLQKLVKVWTGWGVLPLMTQKLLIYTGTRFQFHTCFAELEIPPEISKNLLIFYIEEAMSRMDFDFV